MITSAQNTKIKLARSLMGRPKERREANAFVVEGARLTEEALSSGQDFHFLLHAPDLGPRAHTLLENAQAAGILTEEIAPHLLQSLSETETSQGLLAVLALRPLAPPENVTFALIPDAVHDPGNLGTLLRTAAAAGVDLVCIPPETTDPYAPKVVRAAMGAHFRLPIVTMDWAQIAECAQRLNIFIADAHGAETCWQADFRPPLALIVGGEAEGASPAARKLATKLVSIPMPGQMESLNAGVAGAILLFEAVRQRNAKTT